MSSELNECLTDFLLTLRGISVKYEERNKASLSSINFLKSTIEEKKPQYVVRTATNLECKYSEMFDDGRIRLELPCGVLIEVDVDNVSYMAVKCFFLKVTFPSLTHVEIAKQTSYTRKSTVYKSIRTVSKWGVSVNIPKHIKIL